VELAESEGGVEVVLKGFGYLCDALGDLVRFHHSITGL
jgi:hypothetical protein